VYKSATQEMMPHTLKPAYKKLLPANYKHQAKMNS